MTVNEQIQQHSQQRLTALVRKRNADTRLQELVDEMERVQVEADQADRDAQRAETAMEALRPLMEDNNGS